MKILIVTQNEPFFLRENLKYLLNKLPENIVIVGVVLTKVSPFGKRESFIKKAVKTKKIFGTSFFLYYSFKLIHNLIFKQSLKNFLIQNKIPIIKIKGSINSKYNIESLKNYSPDLILSILGNQIFKQPLINLAPKGCINLHSAFLPKYRGLMPTFWVLKNKEDYTGVSVFFVDEGIDSGPIIVQEKIKIGNKTQHQLIRETKKKGMDLIIKAINMINNDELKLIANPNSEKSYYSFPTREDVKCFRKAGKKFF